jgi:hypothetical protein
LQTIAAIRKKEEETEASIIIFTEPSFSLRFENSNGISIYLTGIADYAIAKVKKETGRDFTMPDSKFKAINCASCIICEAKKTSIEEGLPQAASLAFIHANEKQ